MRRSSSISQIPLPNKNERPRSKSSSRSSFKDIPGSSNRPRPGSIDRLQIPTLKRSTSFSNLTTKKSISATPTLAGSKSYGMKKSSFLTPTLNSGYKRSLPNVTPASSRSRSRSPFKFGSERQISDKQWISKQYAKVLNFLKQQPNCYDYIGETFKPPLTIQTFVYVIVILFKEIDVYMTEINTVNYKEIVLNTLKILHYPGNVSNSLLKTVNTKHAWPQVICIFSWLVDLIMITKRVEMCTNPALTDNIKYKKAECVKEYIIGRYILYNNGEDQTQADKEFAENFGRILNIDEEKGKQLEDEVKSLSKLKENQLQQIIEQKEKHEVLNAEIHRLQSEVDAFYTGRDERQEQVDDDIALLKARRDKLQERIKEKNENIEKLNEIIKKQPCTVKEKKTIMKRIEEMRHTIELKKEKMQTQRNVKNECEVKLIEARKKVEIEVYRLNNSLMQLILLYPELKILHLNETDYLSEEFGNEIATLKNNIKMFEAKFAKDLDETKSLVSLTKSKISDLQNEIQKVERNIKKLDDIEISIKNKNEMCAREIESMEQQREQDRKRFIEKLQNLKETNIRLNKLKQNFAQLEKMKIQKVADFEIQKQKSLDFFCKLHESVTENVENMKKIRTEIVDMLDQRTIQVQETQDKIVEHLSQLEECKD